MGWLGGVGGFHMLLLKELRWKIARVCVGCAAVWDVGALLCGLVL